MSCDSDPARLVAGLRASRSAQSHRLRLPIRLRQCSTVCRSNLRTALRRLRWLGAVTWAAPGGRGRLHVTGAGSDSGAPGYPAPAGAGFGNRRFDW